MLDGLVPGNTQRIHRKLEKLQLFVRSIGKSIEKMSECLFNDLIGGEICLPAFFCWLENNTFAVSDNTVFRNKAPFAQILGFFGNNAFQNTQIPCNVGHYLVFILVLANIFQDLILILVQIIGASGITDKFIR